MADRQDGALLVQLAQWGSALGMLGLRTWVRDETKVEERLLAPGTHTLNYEVPNGQDPAMFRAALAEAHFTSISLDEGGTERLTIACEEQERSQVLDVLEHAHAAGAARTAHSVRQVRFTDEG